MQDHYNLLYREEEREMLPLCADQGIGVLPWSPLARGRLTRDWDEATDAVGDRRVRPDALRPTSASDRVIVERVAEIADRARRAPGAGGAGVAVRASPVVTAPIVGATQAAAPRRRGGRASSCTLTDDEVARLEEPYEPHAVVGFA